ncbi:hypothetical protein GFS60_07409 (plasmid) [Rhodococcus sp. WAY2]|nr:hypothetical protein GFS60_07409 [Rhodococcus sp. WAY2]
MWIGELDAGDARSHLALRVPLTWEAAGTWWCQRLRCLFGARYAL